MFGFSCIYRIYRFLHAQYTILTYKYYCKKYKSASVLSQTYLKDLTNTVGLDLFFREEIDGKIKQGQQAKKNVFYVGTNDFQDTFGFIQGMQNSFNVFRFKGVDNNYQLLFPRSTKEILEIRELNSLKLVEEFESLSCEISFDYLIGQMWNYVISSDALTYLKKKYNIKIINISMDDRHSFHLFRRNIKGDVGVYGLLRSIDLALTAAPECTAWYRKFGCPSYFFPEASMDWKDNCVDTSKDIDVLFVGARYGYRIDIIESLISFGINVVCYGKGWDNGYVSNDGMLQLFKRAKIILGIGGILHTKKFVALKLRDFDGYLSGTFYLPQFNPDFYILSKESDIIMWTNVLDLRDKIFYYLEFENERENYAKKISKEFRRVHTWNVRFEKLRLLLNLHES